MKHLTMTLSGAMAILLVSPLLAAGPAKDKPTSARPLGGMDPLVLVDNAALVGHASAKSIRGSLKFPLSDLLPKEAASDEADLKYLLDNVDAVEVSAPSVMGDREPDALAVVTFGRDTAIDKVLKKKPGKPKEFAGKSYFQIGDRPANVGGGGEAVCFVSARKVAIGSVKQVQAYLTRLKDKKPAKPSPALVAAIEAVDSTKPIWVAVALPPKFAGEVAKNVEPFLKDKAKLVKDLRSVGVAMDLKRLAVSAGFATDAAAKTAEQEVQQFLKQTRADLAKAKKVNRAVDQVQQAVASLDDLKVSLNGKSVRLEMPLPELSKDMIGSDSSKKPAPVKGKPATSDKNKR